MVTGANKGIGFYTAQQLARRGYVVWVGCRDKDRGEAAAKELAVDGDVRFVSLDVTDAASVAAAAERVGAATDALDVLVNNAGVAIADGEGLPGSVPIDTIERTLAVNLYGALRVTQSFLPLLRQAPAARIVNVSSTMGSISASTDPDRPLGATAAFAYPISKTALNSLTAWLSVELEDTPIKVNSVCPGFNDTDMNGHTGTQHPSQGAEVVVRAATLPPEGPSGTFFDANGTVAW